MAFISINNLTKIYKMGEIELKALNNVSFNVNKGELVCILGPSGAGKTTLLNLLGGMDDISSGNLNVDNINVGKLSDKELIEYRRNHIGFVFQFYNLVQNLTALENVELAVQITSKHLDPKEIMIKVGLENKMNNFPSQLSGGEQQRVAIARALAKNPSLLLCDEPTGALDYQTGKQILKLLSDISKQENMTVIIITHNNEIAKMCNKIIKLKNGEVEEIIDNVNPLPLEEIEW